MPLDPQLRGLSVKVRAGGALEVKVYRGSRGILQVPGRARGRLEAWEKWSFPCRPLRQDSAGPAGWQPVRKRLQATAALVFAQPLPAGLEPGPDYSRSYAEWQNLATFCQTWEEPEALALMALSVNKNMIDRGEHLDDDHNPGRLGFRGDVPEAHGRKDGHREVQGVGAGQRLGEARRRGLRQNRRLQRFALLLRPLTSAPGRVYRPLRGQ